MPSTPHPEVSQAVGPPQGTSAAILVLVLAFLMASVPVRNSDFWLHLAAGRNLVKGSEASFSYLQDTSWVDHNWLYGILLYGGHAWLGQTALAVFKAGLAAGIGLILLAAGRVGRTAHIFQGLPAGATMLTLVAMGPWLSFRPVFVSYLCFALAIYFLRRFERGAGDFQVFLAVAVLFALWANLDGWFILGNLLVGCWCVGQLMRRPTAEQMPGRPLGRAVPALLFLCSVAACLVNPNHIFVFLPGGEWLCSGVAQHLQADPLLRTEILAPWRDIYLSGRFFRTGPGLGFWLLVLLSLLSFALSRESRGSRGVVWGVFLLLSFFQTQVIPFFAMVAGVTLALNAGAWSAGTRLAWGRRASLARAGLILTALALAAGAWIGFFQSSVLEPRRWTVEADPALERVANELAQWRRQGRLGDGNGFHLAPEAANQLAWLCPEEKSFLNSHLRVSPVQALEYVAVRNGLLARPGAETTNWRDILRAHKINHVVIYSKNAAEAEAVAGNLIKMTQEWPLLYLGGGAAIFGWRDPLAGGAAARPTSLGRWRDPLQDARQDPFAGLEKSLDQLAYDPREARLAPSTWPGRAPQAFHWWEAFWKRRALRAPDLREARMALAVYEALAPMYISHNFRVWNACLSAGLVAEESGPGFPVLPVTGGVGRNLFLSGQDAGPAAALYLAIRAARRAIHEDTDEAGAYFTLAEAYNHLNNSTRERLWAGSFAGLGRIRTVQAITAYHNALRLDADLTVAHDRLAHLFISMGYKDLALKHLRDYVRCVRRQGLDSGESRDSLARGLARPEGILKNLTKDVEDLTDRFNKNLLNLKVFDRASLAGRMGLAGTALDILLESDVAAFGTDGMDLELKLLLLTGNAENVRLWMNQEHESVLHAYHWNKIQLHASIGNYAVVDEELDSLDRMRALNRDDLTLHHAAGFILANGILAPTWGGPFEKMPLKVFLAMGAIPLQTYRLFPDADDVVVGSWMVAQGLNREAKLGVLRGLLALESGRIAQAEDRFRRALVVLYSSSAAPFASEPESFWARAIAEHCLKVVALK